MSERVGGPRGAVAGLAAALIAAGVAACDARPSWDREPVSRQYFDSTGTFVHAGVSTRVDADITPVDPGSLRGDTLTRGFHLLRMRCAACHEAPDPTMKTAEHWSWLIGRMRDKTATAGLIPMTEAEADTILGFLRRHASR